MRIDSAHDTPPGWQQLESEMLNCDRSGGMVDSKLLGFVPDEAALEATESGDLVTVDDLLRSWTLLYV